MTPGYVAICQPVSTSKSPSARHRGPRLGPVNLTATIRQNPPDHRGGYTLESRALEAAADTYDQAYANLVDQVPGGWSMLFVRAL